MSNRPSEGGETEPLGPRRTVALVVGSVAFLGGVFWATIWALSEPGRLQSLVWPAISITFGIGLLVRLLRRRRGA